MPRQKNKGPQSEAPWLNPRIPAFALRGKTSPPWDKQLLNGGLCNLDAISISFALLSFEIVDKRLSSLQPGF
jgi:hypothetical protein